MSHLCKAFGNETGLENRLWCLSILDFERKFGSNNLSITRTGYDSVCAMSINGAELLEDSGSPLWRIWGAHSFLEGMRFFRRSIRCNVMRRTRVQSWTSVGNEGFAGLSFEFLPSWFGLTSWLTSRFSFRSDRTDWVWWRLLRWRQIRIRILRVHRRMRRGRNWPLWLSARHVSSSLWYR